MLNRKLRRLCLSPATCTEVTTLLYLVFYPRRSPDMNRLLVLYPTHLVCSFFKSCLFIDLFYLFLSGNLEVTLTIIRVILLFWVAFLLHVHSVQRTYHTHLLFPSFSFPLLIACLNPQQMKDSLYYHRSLRRFPSLTIASAASQKNTCSKSTLLSNVFCIPCDRLSL